MPIWASEDGARQLDDPEVQAEERSLADLDALAERRMALVVEGERATVEVLVVGHDHAAVARR